MRDRYKFMNEIINLWPLLGIVIITLGFVLRINPMLSIILSALVTTLAAKMLPIQTLSVIGEGFLKTRNLSILVLLPLAMVGLIERHGMREKAQMIIGNFTSMTVSKLLVLYLFLRQVTASFGLNSLGGHPQMVRPILAPMADKLISEKYHSDESSRDTVKALAAATDNIGLFFGEDIFVAFGAVALMATFLQDNHIKVEMLNIALWGIPTAIFALLIHGFMICYWERKIAQVAPNKGVQND